MMSSWRSWSVAAWLTHRPPRLLVGAIAALALAAVIVLHLEWLAASEQEQQLRVNLQQACEHTAMFTAQRVRAYFGAAARDTIEATAHPTYKRYDMKRITAAFVEGTERYPYVDAFVFWSDRFSGPLARQAMFVPSRRAVGAGFRALSDEDLPDGWLTHDTLGPRLWDEAMAQVPARLSWVVTDVDSGGRRYQTVLHYLWEDGSRSRIFAIVGLVVDLARVETELFPALLQSDLLVLRGGGNLSMAVRDGQNRLLHGTEFDDADPMSSAKVSALFFHDEGREPWTRMAAEAPLWTVYIHAAMPPRPVLRRLLSFSLLALLVIALYCAVSVERQGVRLSRMQSDFIANVTHQLKTPLALLTGAAETLVLRRVSTPEKLSEYAEIVQSETTRLTELVHSILEVSRVEARPQRLVRQPVDLGALVARTVEEFGMGVSDGFTLRAIVPPQPVMVVADPIAIGQVVLNLLDNAVKYGRRGNAVSVHVEAQASEAVVRVCDTGVGIHPSDLPHIFEKFYRGRNTRSDRRGFGLGLSIVDAIVRGHGGRVWVRSEVGGGSEFSVALRTSAV